MSKVGYVYIMTNKNKTTLYIGVTNDLCRRISEHKNHLIKNSFSDKYNLEYCIYYEAFDYFDLAIRREKELKKWNRQKKEDLISKSNPEWNEVATEKGFVRKNLSFSQMVNDLMNELQINNEVLPSDRNDVVVHSEVPPSGRNDSPAQNEVPPSGRNDGPAQNEVPPSGRNDTSPRVKMGSEGGSKAAALRPLPPKTPPVIPSDSEEPIHPTPPVIPTAEINPNSQEPYHTTTKKENNP